MAVMKRWIVIASEGGIVRHVSPFTKLVPARRRADELGAQMNPEADDVIVWDLALDQPVYNPLKGLDVYA